MHKKVASLISKFTKKEIRTLFNKSKLIYSIPGLDIKVAPRQSSIGRILLVIPKRVGNAPERNLIRRRIKSIFYQEKLYLSCYDFVAICKRDILNISFLELKNIFLSIANKLK